MFFYVFDILWLDGQDVRAAAAAHAQAAAARHADVRTTRCGFTTHRNGDGEAFFAEACRKGWEGLIAKRADSPYARPRSRTG